MLIRLQNIFLNIIADVRNNWINNSKKLFYYAVFHYICIIISMIGVSIIKYVNNRYMLKC